MMMKGTQKRNCTGTVKLGQSTTVSTMSLMLIFPVFRPLPLFLVFLSFSIYPQNINVQSESISIVNLQQEGEGCVYKIPRI